MNNFKERGSITLFIIITLIFVFMILAFIYFKTKNDNTAQKREIQQIEQTYSVDNNELSEEYNEIIK